MYLTVAICTYNNALSLARTLESICNIDPPTETEHQILIINNNCTDHTDQVISNYRAKIPNLKSVNEPRQGLSYARNRALIEADGGFVCFLDDDVIVDPAWLKAVALSFDQYQADIVGGKSYLILPSSKPDWFYDNLEPYLSKIDYGNQPLINTDKELYGLNFAVKKDTALALGGFNEALGRRGTSLLSGEEKDFQNRVIAGGGKCVYQPDAIVGHIVPKSRMKKAWFAKRAFYGELSSSQSDRSKEPLFATSIQIMKCTFGLLKSLIFRDCSASRFFYKQMITVMLAGKMTAEIHSILKK
ncbi:MAG: glycosyltransferase [Desulfobulbaceae bacterium]|nr:glycosyltransferase [Desulfobulbaceae bacterium]